MIPTSYLPLLFLTGGAAGLVDSVAGGGGLLTVPVLLGTGLPVPLALGTNKLQSSFGSLTAAHNYLGGGGATWRECRLGAAFTFAGAAIGTAAVQRLPAGLLERAIPFLLLAILVYTAFTPNLGKIDAHPRAPRGAFYVLTGLALGFYDGSFGPGTGTLWAFALVWGLGLNLARATAVTKVMNFTSNAVSLGVFALGGHVLLVPGLVMGVGQMLGARVGSTLVLRRGAGFVRPLFLAVAFLTTVKLFWRLVF